MQMEPVDLVYLIYEILDQMEDTQAGLGSVKELHDAIKNGSDQETIVMKKQVVDNLLCP